MSTPNKRSFLQGARNWAALSKEEKVLILREFCGTEGSRLRAEYSGVLGIGIGYKSIGGEVDPVICLAFLVKEKGICSSPVPPQLPVEFKLRRGRRLYIVPTDLEALGTGGGPQSQHNAAAGISAISTTDATQPLKGAVCCIVKQPGQRDRYLLSCHHVLALSILTNNCQAKDSTVYDSSSTRIGKLYEYVSMSPETEGMVDAALALIDSEREVSWNYNGVRPKIFSSGLLQPNGCNIYSPRGIIGARFVKEWADIELPYPGCGSVRILAAYQFYASTLPGDSGSPVIDSDQILHGMHFWGNPNNGICFSIPAFILFQQGLFSFPLEIAN